MCKFAPKARALHANGPCVRRRRSEPISHSFATSRRFHTMAAGHRNNAASDPNFSTTKPLDFSHGQIYRTENKDQPSLRRADFWTIEVAGAKKLSARNARTKRLSPQTVRLRDRAGRKAKASLPIWSS